MHTSRAACAHWRAFPTRAAFVVVVVFAACQHGSSADRAASTAQRVRNLHALARLYGVIRWFHPSDAASAVNWNRFAIQAARLVMDAPDREVLRDRLAGLIEPLAPTVQFALPGETLIDAVERKPTFTASLQVVSWHHSGFGDPGGGSYGPYRSQRRYRPVDARADDAPIAGSAVDLDLGDGIHARVPIALYAWGGHTLGDDPDRARWRDRLTPLHTEFDAAVSAADVVVQWNVLEHFWPYWGDVPIDPDRALDTALADAIDDRDLHDHNATLRRLSAAVPDGHAWAICPPWRDYGSAPFTADRIEGQILVTASIDARIRRGDRILGFDGRDADAVLAAAETLQSGSPQWKRMRAMGSLLRAPLGTRLRVRLRREGKDFDVDVALREPQAPLEHPHLPFELRDGGIWYVDLSRISLFDFPALLPRLASAQGVVFDMREYPMQSATKIFERLRSATPRGPGDHWIFVPEITWPDHQQISWRDVSGSRSPQPPYLEGRLAFLIGPHQLSFGESLLSEAEDYHLGFLVGAPTAGINGDKAVVTVPSGCRIAFTGARVTKRDGSALYQVGIVPTHPVEPTLAGVRAGRDEVLDTALARVRAAPAR